MQVLYDTAHYYTVSRNVGRKSCE